MKKQNVINWLKSTEIPMSKISKSTGVSRKTLYNYMNGEATSDSKLKLIETAYHNEINIKGEDVVLNSKYIIELQNDKIKYQQNEINELKSALKEKQAESTHWDALSYDYITTVTLIKNGVNFGRKFDSVSDLKKQSSVLGYSVKELEQLWDIGTSYDRIHDHPIDSLFCKETISMVREQTKTLPVLFDAMKSIVGNHYIPHPLIYKHKNGQKVGAISYCKVEWIKMKIIAKVQFITQ